jgi:hypothetical protein
MAGRMRYSGRTHMSTAASPAREDRFVRIKTNQVLCNINGCGKAASLVLNRFMGLSNPARLAYCEHHARQVAEDLNIPIAN